MSARDDHAASGEWPTADELGIRHGAVRQLYETWAKQREGITPEEWEAKLAGEEPIRPPYPSRRRRRPDALDLEDLLALLREWWLVDSELERAIRLTYELDPFAVSVLVSSVVTGVKAGTVRSAGGVLITGLRTIYRRVKP